MRASVPEAGCHPTINESASVLEHGPTKGANEGPSWRPALHDEWLFYEFDNGDGDLLIQCYNTCPI